jgi:hypothetical protein
MAKIKESLHALKAQAAELGLTPYASLYGDRRQLKTWKKLLEGSEELIPLPKRAIEVSDRAQIKWKLAIAFFTGTLVLLCLLKPIYSKVLPVKITIQIGAK